MSTTIEEGRAVEVSTISYKDSLSGPYCWKARIAVKMEAIIRICLFMS